MQPNQTPPKGAIKVYAAILNQQTDEIPVAIVLQNTMTETITWTRSASGVYRFNMEGISNQNTTVFITPEVDLGLYATLETDGITLNANDLDGIPYDGLNNVSIEIKLYKK